MKPRTSNARLAGLALAAAALAFSGCDQFLEKQSKDDLAAGDRKASAGDFRGAVAAYEAALDGTARTAEAHFKLGLLYDDKIQRPADAIHHLERYLELEPQGARAKDARAVIASARQRVAMAQGKGTVTQAEAARLKNEVLKLTKSLNQARVRVAAPAPVPADKNSEVARKPIPPGTRTHVVQPGETMASIARKYYQNTARWRDIQDANYYSTNGTPTIKPGQTLIIPK